MINFVVTVLCAVHIGSKCPIPNGHYGTYQAHSKEECISVAKNIIAGFGYTAADFRIVCKEK